MRGGSLVRALVAAAVLALAVAGGCSRPEDQTLLRFLGFQAAGSSGTGTLSMIEGDARDGTTLKVDASFENQTIALGASGAGTGGITIYRVDVDYTMANLDPPSFSNAVNLYAPPAAAGSSDATGGGTVVLSDMPIVPVFVKQWLVSHDAAGGDGFIEMTAHVDFRARTDAGDELTVSAAIGVTLTDTGGDDGGGGGGGTTEPRVTVQATTPDAVEDTGADGEFTVYRNGDKTGSLTVAYTIGTGGTAATPSFGALCETGADYIRLSGTVTIAPGSPSKPIDVIVCPESPPVAESPQTVTITLSAGAGYSLAEPRSATVTIRDSN